MAHRRRRCLPLLLAGCAGVQGVATAAPITAPGAEAAPTAAGALVAPARPRTERLSEAAAALWAGRLGEAHRALLEISDREVGMRDPALDFWSELSALLRCEPYLGPPRPAPRLGNEWDRLRRLVQIERLRSTQRAIEETKPDDGAAGRPLPVSDTPPGALTWPTDAERWSDEAPIAHTVLDHCAPPDKPGARAATTITAAAILRSPKPSAPTAAARGAEATLVRELAAALPAAHPALPALLLDQAILAIAAGDGARALAPLAGLPQDAADPHGPFSADERAALALAWAVAADAAATAGSAASHAGTSDQRDAALARLRAALALDLPHDVRRALSFRIGELLRAAGRIDEAVAAVGPPPHGDDALGRYLAFRQMEAHVRAGRRAEAMAEARAALGPHRRATVDGDAALAAIDDLALRLVVGSPISAESIEVIEAFGTPSERLGRMERFAQMAGAVEAHASEMEAFLWLLQNDPDENRQLHHLARASVAAARAGDRKQFALTFAELAGQENNDNSDNRDNHDGKGDEKRALAAFPTALDPDPKLKTRPKPAKATGLIDSPEAERLYKSRRLDRSLSWQRAMLIVARDALPALVENDDQANLKILVDRLQRHLTEHGRGPVDAELTTVYRAASAHLRGGARGYAQRVGGGKRPLLLGDIAVERHYQVPEPEVTITPPGPRSLLWVPASGNDPAPARLKRWETPLGVSMTVVEGKP